MRRDPRVVVATVVCAAYLLAARGVGNLYPISTFPMFAESPGEAVSRVVARTASGEFLEVTQLSSWSCDNLPHLDATQCDGVSGVPYIDREREQHIRTHAGQGDESVELVRRIFAFDGKNHPSYCPITRCTAQRR